MDCNLENKILLKESEFKNLYPWSLQELDKDNKEVGSDLIPWGGFLYFTASELRHNYSIDIHKSEKINEDAEHTEYTENIFGILHSGACRDGKILEDEISYSMFGTNRRINHFRLFINKNKNPADKAKCRIHGFVSYTMKTDFIEETMDDCVDVELTLSPEQFNKLSELIKDKRVDILEICLRNVSGFYSDWSPSPSTDDIKILTDSEDHKVVIKDGCTITPLRLCDVNEFNITIIQRHALNPKQDLRAADIDKIFEEPQENNEDKNKEAIVSLISSQLIRNEIALKKLRTPLWLIFIVLCFILGNFI